MVGGGGERGVRVRGGGGRGCGGRERDEEECGLKAPAHDKAEASGN